mmetsp:Transcript_27357/g.71626  ORF Transcript_27357/g.71626 Transcript_27357/m.71626 type:complete len:216 (-) Transcript_27357:485-1132(-)
MQRMQTATRTPGMPALALAAVIGWLIAPPLRSQPSPRVPQMPRSNGRALAPQGSTDVALHPSKQGRLDSSSQSRLTPTIAPTASRNLPGASRSVDSCSPRRNWKHSPAPTSMPPHLSTYPVASAAAAAASVRGGSRSASGPWWASTTKQAATRFRRGASCRAAAAGSAAQASRKSPLSGRRSARRSAKRAASSRGCSGAPPTASPGAVRSAAATS